MIDFLTEEEADMLREDFKSLVEDQQVSVKIFYRQLVSRSLNTGTGTMSNTYADTALDAYLGNHTAHDVAASGGLLRIGDQFFIFDPKLLTRPPRSDDMILMNITRAGSIETTAGSADVAGVGTRFLLDGVQGGDTLAAYMSALVTINVKSVSSDNALKLASSWPITSPTQTAFTIYRTFEIIDRIIDPLPAAVKLSVRRAGA